MVARNEIGENCFTPRSYQVELLEKACKKNTIVQLGTGAGKTFIAVLLLKEYGIQMFAPLAKGGKRSFFIVEKVALVEQQAQHISRHTSFNVGRLHGNLNNDIWEDKSRFTQFLEEHHVIVVTAQVLLDLINHALFSLESASVLIIDECHHALGTKHAYRLIMSNYKDLLSASKPVPRILGLTASLIKEKMSPNKLEEQLTKMETILCSSIETASDLISLSKYGAKPREAVVACTDFDFNSKVKKLVDKFLESTRKFCDETNEFNSQLDTDPRSLIREGHKKTFDVLRQLGPWAAWKVCQLFEKQLTKTLRQNMLPDKTKLFVSIARTSLITVRRLLELEISHVNSLEELRKFIPHRVFRIFELLEVFSPEFQKIRMGKEEPEILCGLIFVDQRYVAYALNVMIRQIRHWDPKFKFISSDYVVGASGSTMAHGETELYKRQGETLRKFHRGELNILVATSVLEEGVDVKQCNLVVKFDRPPDIRSYIQSKGRARRAGARYIALIEQKDAEACSADFQDFNIIEKMLLQRYRNLDNPVDDVLVDDVDAIMPPYVVESTNATVKMSSAIQLVNRYCGKLPSDIFTQLVPQNRIIPVKEGDTTKFLAELLLPINSPLKHAIRLEKPMATKKLAQMAVALEACRQLHQNCELDDNLLPKGRESIAMLMQHIDDEPDEFAPGMTAKVGSSKRKQLYDKKVARALNESMPTPGKPCYIYVLEFERVKEPSAETNPKKRKFADPLEYEYCFGIITAVKLPKVPPFPIFLRQGDMRVMLSLSKEQVTLDEETLDSVKCFHDYLFTQVLQLCKIGLVFEMSTSTPLNTLVVPLNRRNDGSKSYVINMNYVRDVVQNLRKMPRVPEVETRKNFKFRPEDFKDAIVMPWYRNVEQPMFYYVAEILDEMHPSSKFPDENYETFNDYFIKKYTLEIFDQHQSLLDVDFTSTRLNLLQPKASTVKRRSTTPSSSETSVKETPNSQRQILVPELMDVHPISATLWNLISALPSIFYRVDHLLLADELRVRILKDAFGKTTEDVRLSDSLNWSPLTYPSTYEERQSLIVSKIQQLRDMNKMHGSRNEEATTLNDESSFEIGVWDPDEAEKLGLSVTLRDFPFADPEDDTVGLVPSRGVAASGDLSDEEDDEKAVFMFDYSRHLVNRAEKSMDFAAPREVLVSGWGETHGEVQPTGWGEIPDATQDSLFQIIDLGQGHTTGLNLDALLADVERVLLPIDEDVATSRADVEAKPHVPAETAKPAQEPQPAQPSLDEASSNIDDRDRPKRTEEIVDLDKFDDEDEDDDLITARSCGCAASTSDDEFEVLKEGESEKRLRDEVVVKAAPLSPKKAGLSGPSTDFRFSFDKESPLANSIVSEGNVDKLLHKDSDIGYGVSPCLLLTALTTSNANDGVCLERLETIGDSFLKYAVTDYLFHTHTDQHEGKLSFARSKEVSNCNLYRLGKKLGIPQLIVASKFDAHDSWLPPCYAPTTDFKAPNSEDAEEKDREIEELLAGRNVEQKAQRTTGWDQNESSASNTADGVETITFPKPRTTAGTVEEISPLPYNLLTQQNISDKSIADAVEALIGAHLLALGPKLTLKVMKWIGLKVLTEKAPATSPLLRFIDTPEDPNLSQKSLDGIWRQFQMAQLEDKIGYHFKNKAFLVQAFTHASYMNNRITGCYQRLEFLGDAVLDYMITRYLYEDGRQYSPGVLTDLRSALVNNTIFASLAVKYGFHKHFIAMCAGLHYMIDKFVKLCAERNFFEANFNAEMYMVTTEEEIDEGQEEDVEVPKAMSDIFESIAGAIYLDSDCNLDVVWQVMFNLMKETIEECCANPPRSPIRELMELESSKARFSKMERIIESGKVRVTVDVGNSMRFTGMGRNYRIAKTTAAKRALRYLKSLEEQKLKTQRQSK